MDISKYSINLSLCLGKFQQFLYYPQCGQFAHQLRHLDVGNDVVRLKQVAGGQGILLILKNDHVFRQMFYVPHSVLPLVDKYVDVILAETTQQINCRTKFYGRLR